MVSGCRVVADFDRFRRGQKDLHEETLDPNPASSVVGCKMREVGIE